MVNDGDNKDNGFDEIRDLLKKHYKPTNEIESNDFWDKISKKIDSMYHKELFSDKHLSVEGTVLSDEERYYLGLEEYINNKVTSLKHKNITEHLLSCKECRSNYMNLLDKKKEILKTKVS